MLSSLKIRSMEAFSTAAAVSGAVFPGSPGQGSTPILFRKPPGRDASSRHTADAGASSSKGFGTVLKRK